MQKILLAITLFSIKNSIAVSQLGAFDGIIEISVRNNQACFYLNNQQDINSIYVSAMVTQNEKMEGLSWNINRVDSGMGSSLKTCVMSQNLQFNVPYDVSIQDVMRKSIYAEHNARFCIVKQNQSIFISRVERKFKNGADEFSCSRQPFRNNKNLSFWEKVLVFLGLN